MFPVTAEQAEVEYGDRIRQVKTILGDATDESYEEFIASLVDSEMPAAFMTLLENIAECFTHGLKTPNVDFNNTKGRQTLYTVMLCISVRKITYAMTTMAQAGFSPQDWYNLCWHMSKMPRKETQNVEKITKEVLDGTDNEKKKTS